MWSFLGFLYQHGILEVYSHILFILICSLSWVGTWVLLSVTVSPECWTTRWICLSSHISSVVHSYSKWDQSNKKTGVKIKHQRISQSAGCFSPGFRSKSTNVMEKQPWRGYHTGVVGHVLGLVGQSRAVSRCEVSSCRANLVSSGPLMMNQCPLLKNNCAAQRHSQSDGGFVVKEREGLGLWHIWDKKIPVQG